MKKIRIFFAAMVMLVLSATAYAQRISVKGTVLDESGDGIVQASVVLKGNNAVYTMTDISGAFTLNVPADGTLVIESMGYQTAEVPVNGRAVIEVVLATDTQILDETIVVAYGTATKSSFTGSATQVKAETIEKKVATSVTSALAGTTPGVQITSASGDPAGGGSNTIRIRGIGSMSASNSPLIVVDGVPYDGAISDINPQDVESMSVLKDAAASAIYGHRGANGVVIITTKKGNPGDAKVKFDGRIGVNSRLIPQYDVITDPGQYYETFYTMLYNQYYYSGHSVAESYAYANTYLFDQNNGGLGYQVFTVPDGQNLIGTNFKLNPNATLGYSDGEFYYTPDDWYKEAFHNSVRQEYNVSASGSVGSKMNYYASVGYLDNSGIVNNSGYKRYTGRLNAEYQAKSWMRLTSSMSISHTDSQTADWSDSYGSSGTDGYVGVSHSRMFTVNQQYLAEYKFDIANDHHVDVLAGFEKYELTSQGLSGSNYHLFNPFVGELNNADGTGSMVSANSSTNRYTTQGFLGRVQYDYNGKIFVTGSYRRDASSRFAEGHRWGNFGSAGAAWLISSEDWFKVKPVDMLKLKVSYGIQGNDNIGGYYPYSDQYNHSWSETDGYKVEKVYVGNEELTWETSKSFNIGLDFELLKGYLNGTFEWFSRKTEDLLYSKSVPQSAGNPTGAIPVNVGSILNRGFELSLDGKILATKNIYWTWNANLSHYVNEILELDESVSENGIRTGNRILMVGGSIYDAYMFKYAGVNPTTGQAQYYSEVLLDENGEPTTTAVQRPTQKQIDDKATTTVVTSKFSDATQYNLGSVLPKLFGGFGTSFNAYGFDLSCQLSFQLGGKYYDGSYQALMHTQAAAGQAWHKDILNAWTPENTHTDVPRNDGDVQVAQSALDRFMISSNYLSLNNVTFGYTLPTKFTKKFGVDGLRLYVAGDNLAVLTARKGVDPRFSMGLGSMTSGTGLNSGYYSAMRSITGGITLTF